MLIILLQSLIFFVEVLNFIFQAPNFLLQQFFFSVEHDFSCGEIGHLLLVVVHWMIAPIGGLNDAITEAIVKSIGWLLISLKDGFGRDGVMRVMPFDEG